MGILELSYINGEYNLSVLPKVRLLFKSLSALRSCFHSKV